MTTGTQRSLKLDTSKVSTLSGLLAQQFSDLIVGQDKAVAALLDMVEAHRAGFGEPNRPAGVGLFLGPTGTGKTHVVETLAQSLFGSKQACIRIDCAEFQHSHEIAKLIGSPPGYLGHRETAPTLTQEALNQWHTPSLQLSIVLFDEIEKASDALWNILLGILDNASLTLGDNRKVNFHNTIIILTSNLGAREMTNKRIGFGDKEAVLDQKRLEQIALSAAKSKFTPEFMNRLTNVVTFHTLTPEQIARMLDIELMALEGRILDFTLKPSPTTPSKAFKIAVSPKAKRTLLAEGYSTEYGARFMKRTIDFRIQRPLAKLYNSGQIAFGDTIIIDDSGLPGFDFYVEPKEFILKENNEETQ
jgi:ATP-dependent Clp protease ATP-binding subunit ClpB